jgi:tRNA modification GTPase
MPIHVVDTAGLRDSPDMVEQMGIARAWEAIEGADAVLFLHDLTRQDAPEYIAADEAIASALGQKLHKSVSKIDVWNKADVVPAQSSQNGIYLSAKTGEGLGALRTALLTAAGWQAQAGGGFIARERHLQALRRVHAHLQTASDHLGSGAQSLDILAEELRLAQNALSEITGAFSTDDLLGVIFSQFCIGK